MLWVYNAAVASGLPRAFRAQLGWELCTPILDNVT
jgi:hypothetical protein